MTIEQEIQGYYLDMLQKYKIDFIRIKNAGHKSARGAYSYGVNPDGEDNNKHFPDTMFVFMGKIYCREFGEKGKHSDRKEKQARRMHHWHTQGGVDVLTVYDMETAKKDWIVILGEKNLEIY